MNAEDDDIVKELLCSAVPPITNLELESDLWPRMLALIDARKPRWSVWDLVAVAAAAAGVVSLPASSSLIFYLL